MQAWAVPTKLTFPCHPPHCPSVQADEAAGSRCLELAEAVLEAAHHLEGEQGGSTHQLEGGPPEGLGMQQPAQAAGAERAEAVPAVARPARTGAAPAAAEKVAFGRGSAAAAGDGPEGPTEQTEAEDKSSGAVAGGVQAAAAAAEQGDAAEEEDAGKA